MKKIDLHIHTVCTPSDAPFEFSLETLKKYIEIAELDCIAITNHNVFNLDQFKIISGELNITVLPGIEIDLGGGHLLLISNPIDLDDFTARCQKLTNLITYPHPRVRLNDFKGIFTDLDQYILIPHYDKSPTVHKSVLDDLKGYISAGEVQSAKKFIQTDKKEDSLVPVLFSDSRMKTNLSSFPSRQTFLNISNCDFRSIRLGLTKKEYVSLTKEEGNDFIEIMDSGIKLSTGLNIILGKRSSGKSHTLNLIHKSSGEDDVKYIKQFELLESDEEKDKKDFDEHVSNNKSDVTEKYLSLFKNAVDDIQRIDIRNDESQIERYLNSLMENANNQMRTDSYSKAALFSDTLFKLKDIQGLKDLIRSTEMLLDNLEYGEIIARNISRKDLITLYRELVSKLKEEETERNIKKFTNEIVSNIKSQLSIKTSLNPIEEINLNKIALNRVKIYKFNELVNLIKKYKRIDKKELYGYHVVAEREQFNSASELLKVIRRKVRLVPSFEKYDNPIAYIARLKDAGVEDTDIYKLFAKITYRILNRYGDDVSGGERSEYRLLKKLHDAKSHDILLIDEPESSFDNTFLFESVNSIIKDLSKHMPVVLVTHNSTVGGSIVPDQILYTTKTFVDNKLIYDVYFGLPTDKYLYTRCGKKIENYTVQINSLEAGKAPYEKRNSDYENIKS
ncbi:hypothetical protein [Photobacterium phosphoreum]|uniref:hypothetical protein n=1 Tax=Photobacterium phosphoreum TaxID=659 RepID=UPI001E5D2324|nr:hypothetical protein [Photobacterium phosphoreum]MCD9471331.1 hypothetical protein [Photobacterium phosphoreum]